MTKPPLSCFIIAKNEADRIARTIRSVSRLADEIIVVDSGSTDGTQAIAAAEGARVIFNAWPGFGQQKRFGEMQCRHDWLINLDADEVVSKELADEIRTLFSAGAPPHAVYGMAVNNVYPGHEKPRLWARDHYCLRLYDRRRARFKDSTLFDSVDPGGETVGGLTGSIHHFSMRSLDDMIRKLDERARYQALHLDGKPKWTLALRMITEFPVSFIKYYLLRRQFTGGLMGFHYAMIIAFFRYVRVVRLWQAAAAKDRVAANDRLPR
jgi:glycosyltransferase involved in cell wall biosynthesis